MENLEIVQRTDDYLRRRGMHPDTIDPNQELPRFLTDMKDGLAGLSAHLAMLPSYVSSASPIASPRKALVLDAGGTNLRRALVTFHENGPVIEELETRSMPGIGSPISKEEFLVELARFAAPLADKADCLGMCFSYSANIMPDGDGKLIGFSKEVVVNNSAGMMVCAELLAAMDALSIPHPNTFALINDTTATLLGGMAQEDQSQYHGSVGLVLGTGLNMCYPASLSTLTKVSTPFSSSHMIVNTESGDYSGFPAGDFDRELDQASMNPMDHLSEKMVSGAYQGEVILRTLQGGAELFSPGFLADAAQIKKISMAEISAYTDDPEGNNPLASLCRTTEDRQALALVTDRILERAARVIAVILAAPLELENYGVNAPACIYAEGSTFWKTQALREKIVANTDALLAQSGRSCVFRSTSNANLVGAAAAAFQR